MKTRTIAIATILAMVVVSLLTSAAGAQAAITCDGRVATIVGTPGDDRIIGTDKQDIIAGLEGRDVIFGRGGNDIVCGNQGNDVLKGGSGKDRLFGNQGNDKLIGGIGADTLDGGLAKDKLFGGGGGDTVIGGSKADFVNGQNGNDTCELDWTDRFSTCELGDVRGASGSGDAEFTIDVPDDFALSRVDLGGQALQLDVEELYVVELFWVTSTPIGVAVEVLDESGDTIDFFFSDSPSGLTRLLVLDKPRTIRIVDADYFEFVALDDHMIGFLSRDVMGSQPWVWYLADPIAGPADFVLDILPGSNSSVAVETLEGSDSLSEFFFAETEQTTDRVTGTTTFGVGFVAVRARDYSVTFSAAFQP